MNARSARTSRSRTRLMTPGRGDRGRRDGAVRREIWRRGPRPLAWAARDEADYSVELCGGTHVTRARRHPAVQDHLAKARSSSGVRRIEALTGEAARQWLTDRDEQAAGGRRDAQGLARGGPGARRRSGRGAPPARARAGRGEEGAGAWAAAARPRRPGRSRSAATASSARCSTGWIPRSCAAWSTRPSSASARASSRWSRSMRAAPPSPSASPTT